MVLLRQISIAITAALAALGSALFLALNYFYRRRIWSPETEYCMIKEEQEERVKRQVLVLGLDGAGKSSLLRGLGSTEREAKPSHHQPTRGFNFLSLTSHTCQLDFLEIGGGENLRRYWSEYIRKTHILVYLVDASDRHRLPLAKEELHHLLRMDTHLPVVVLGSKQDLPDALSASELREALCLGRLVEQRRLVLLAVQLGSNHLVQAATPDLKAIQDILLQLV